MKYLQKGFVPYEFDFKSFFNKVNVLAAITVLPLPLADLVKELLLNVTYRFKELKEEAELKVIKPTALPLKSEKICNYPGGSTAGTLAVSDTINDVPGDINAREN